MKAVDSLQVIQARRAAKVTQQQAANIVDRNIRMWQKWEYGDSVMPQELLDMFVRKTQGQRRVGE